MDLGPLLSHLLAGGWKLEIGPSGDPSAPVRVVARRHEVTSNPEQHAESRQDWTVLRDRETADAAIQSAWKAVAGSKA